ncbi:EamA family transporter [uncultured Psychromonas sp.]|uniref:DMT family transporter n=1 Tax=uncultured Psychromonas sp. TaxID=173974 RepID=UPI002605C5AE|nr:EamA family transporter [uncultured Psychromonas sp.]
MQQKFAFKAELILVLVTILAGAGWIFSKEALMGMTPLFFISMRFFIGGLVLLLIGHRYFRGVKWQEIKPIILIGAVMAIAMLCWVMGLYQSSNVGVGAFITCMGVVFVPIIGRLMFGDRPAMSIWVALPFAIIGLGFLALSNGLNFEISHLYFLGTAIAVAFQLNLLSRFLLRVHSLVLTSVQLTTAGILLLIVSLLTETLPSSINVDILGWLLASALIATSLRYLLQMYAMSLTPVSHAAVIMNLEPVWAAIFAVFWFGEIMTLGQVFGCCLIFIAMLISRWSQIRKIFKHKYKIRLKQE